MGLGYIVYPKVGRKGVLYLPTLITTCTCPEEEERVESNTLNTP
jgi:hypothetical protein